MFSDALFSPAQFLTCSHFPSESTVQFSSDTRLRHCDSVFNSSNGNEILWSAATGGHSRREWALLCPSCQRRLPKQSKHLLAACQWSTVLSRLIHQYHSVTLSPSLPLSGTTGMCSRCEQCKENMHRTELVRKKPTPNRLNLKRLQSSAVYKHWIHHTN